MSNFSFGHNIFNFILQLNFYFGEFQVFLIMFSNSSAVYLLYVGKG